MDSEVHYDEFSKFSVLHVILSLNLALLFFSPTLTRKHTQRVCQGLPKSLSKSSG